MFIKPVFDVKRYLIERTSRNNLYPIATTSWRAASPNAPAPINGQFARIENRVFLVF
jgi:hypothetical protein